MRVMVNEASILKTSNDPVYRWIRVKDQLLERVIVDSK